MKVGDIPAKDRRTMVRVIKALADADSDANHKPIEYWLGRFGITYEDYSVLAELSMPGLQYAQLYKRTLIRFKALKRDLKALSRDARKRIGAGETSEAVMLWMLDKLDRLFDDYNTTPESLTDKEAGVIK